MTYMDSKQRVWPATTEGAASWSKRRVLVMDLDTQCSASLMLIGGAGWERACREGRTNADYFYDRFDKVAENESSYRNR
jgi:chromosome partitioning protein